MMYIKSTNNARCGIRFPIPQYRGEGITLYNNTGGELIAGDVVTIIYTGTSGQEVQGIKPPAAGIANVLAEMAVAIETIAAGTIGKFLQSGWSVPTMVEGSSADVVAGSYLECISGIIDFDGTATNTAVTKGTGVTKDTFTDSDAGLVTDGYLPGMRVVLGGSLTTAANAGTYTIYTVAAATITFTKVGQINTAEAGITGLTLVAQGHLRTEATTTRSLNSIAIAQASYATNAVALMNCHWLGTKVTLATS